MAFSSYTTFKIRFYHLVKKAIFMRHIDFLKKERAPDSLVYCRKIDDLGSSSPFDYI